ncbi:hypothetical protein CAEBREN_00400 [Caenorhabditis brenneri]|uniref:Uncharacterized protein n=1 Tax=Caenorhabditis brenneri TaxID=135651 RepID=G0NH58_CAEBE|nr:hypothetical protein CAEBREN_00400 [Caenorhabditis brenneri]
MTKILEYSYIILFIFLPLTFAGTQSIRGVGRLLCRGKPAQYAELQLINTRGEKDNIPIGDPVFSDPDGYFEISGSMHQFYPIPGGLRVWHECFYDIGIHHDPCKSLLEVEIPIEYSNDSKLPKKTWEAGIIDLEVGVLRQNLERCDKILADDVFSDSDGYFDISGSTTQITNMDVRLTIWHDCFEDERPRGGCKNWLELQIPSLYVNKGPFPMTFLEMGNLDLEKEQKKEHLDKCSG